MNIVEVYLHRYIIIDVLLYWTVRTFILINYQFVFYGSKFYGLICRQILKSLVHHQHVLYSLVCQPNRLNQKLVLEMEEQNSKI